MKEGHGASIVRRKDYQPPAFLVEQVELDIELEPEKTHVTGKLKLIANPELAKEAKDCELDGKQLELLSVAIDGEILAEDRWDYQNEKLIIRDVPALFELETRVTLNPQENTALEGLYISRGMFCTQCEAEGFRRITFFPDRPDVLARFRTRITADKSSYPLLLSNGNPVETGETEDERHWILWDDPFPKPSYLFALVAGDLACLEDTYTTVSGREISLRIYAEDRDLDKLGHAMESLKRAMAWDESCYGREYDLDIYMIVAVSHFNMGAMENKGLNIFNTACVLAHPKTTTDTGFQRVESVVAHEYFHNWSGNRVTCRDWFQLSLKEGFTVFRDQQFSADMNSAGVKRVEDVDTLRRVQFAEDQGPMAHAVRPDQYQKIDNFYTVTIYEKGAEVVRMQYSLLGQDAFRQATDLYFSRFDGQAVTCDDFVDCMQEVSGQNLEQFRHWYRQAGTPQLNVADSYDNGIYRLQIFQHTPETPGQNDKQPLMIPLSLALLDSNGNHMPLDDADTTEKMFILKDEETELTFKTDVSPVPSLLRGFSAPVTLKYDFSHEQLACLLSHDTDPYCRWDAAQRLYTRAIERLMEDPQSLEDEVTRLASPVLDVLERAGEDPAFAALLLTLPSETVIGDRQRVLDVDRVHNARKTLQSALAKRCASSLWQICDHFRISGSYQPTAHDMGARALRHQALAWLAASRDPQVADCLLDLQQAADNMTDESGALALLVLHQLEGAEQALADFRNRWHEEALVMDVWFSVQARIPEPATLARVSQLLQDSDFDWRVPNRVRAVLGAFFTGNPVAFHRTDGEGYKLFTQALVRLDELNPQIAARLAGAASRLKRLPEPNQQLLREELVNLKSGKISNNLDEVLGKILE